MHIYRSPYRPLDLGFLEDRVRATWSYEGSDIGPWTPETRYAFRLPIPQRFIDQWSLVDMTPTPVLVIEYQRPHGAPRQIHINVDPEVAKLAEGMRLEAEELTTGAVAFYARWTEQDEDDATMDLAFKGWLQASETLAGIIRKHARTPRS